MPESFPNAPERCNFPAGGTVLDDILDGRLVCGCFGRCTCTPRTLVVARAAVGLPTREAGTPNSWRFVSVNNGDATLALPPEAP